MSRRASLTVTEAQAARRSAASTRSSLPQGHSVCPSQWNSLGDVAEGVGLWFGHDMLEAPARLAGLWYPTRMPIPPLSICFTARRFTTIFGVPESMLPTLSRREAPSSPNNWAGFRRQQWLPASRTAGRTRPLP